MSHALNHALRNAPADKPHAPWIESLRSHHRASKRGNDYPSHAIDILVKHVTRQSGQTDRVGRAGDQLLDLREALEQTKDVAPISRLVALSDHSSVAKGNTSQLSRNMKLPKMDSLPSASHVKVNGDHGPPEPENSKLEELKQKVGGSVKQLSTLLKAMREPLPTETGDGTALPEDHKTNIAEKINTVVQDAATEGWDTLEKLMEAGVTMAKGEPTDDKKYLMEHLIQAAVKIPDDFISQKITNTFVTTLWDDLEHPPIDLLGEGYEFRQPDGSKNSLQNPDLGKAGMPYARTVAPKTLQPGNLPDPGMLFDTLMARKESKQHPNRISSMLFYIATIIIHDIFRTDHSDYRKSNTSSYLDLAPLYGSNWAEQKRMRTFKDGKIKPDCFSETRLLSFPPGVGCILIMFNRYHNYVVEQLALINENGRFNPSDKLVDRYGEQGLNKREDDLFQTARLITCNMYINIVLIDYVRTILNLNRTDDNWTLDPRKHMPGTTKATGNQVSAEFNLVYRWHASVSTRDEKWTEALSEQLWGAGVSMSDKSQYEIINKLSGIERDLQAQEPDERPFPALKEEKMERITEGPFKGNYKDDDLAAFLNASIEDCANAMGPQQVPICLRAIEILGIQQARTWQLATLNEFREHFGLMKHQKFSDITSNEEVATALKHLYDTPDNVELYPGLVAEDAKDPKLPGSGLCPSYTVSRGVLSDAVALVRGDRFYTTSYTPASLTNWGYQESSSDLTINNGCVFYKLFLRTLPNNYTPESVYAHYPLTIPSEMKTILRGLKKDHKYDFAVPTHIPHPTLIFGYDAAKNIMEDQDTFKVTWGKAIEFLMGPEARDFMLAGDDAPNAKSRALMEKALYGPTGSSRAMPKGNEAWLDAVKTYYRDITAQLLRDKSYKLGKVNQVDLIRDVGNLAHVHFASELFNLPLKTKDFPHGLFTEHQLYLIMAALFIAVFFDVDPAKSFPLRQQASAASAQLGKLLEMQVRALKTGGSLAQEFLEKVHPQGNPVLKDYGVHMIAQLLKQDPDVESLVYGNLFGTLAGMVANQGQLFGQALDYLFTEGREHISAVAALAQRDDEQAFEELMHYFMEFSRLYGETGLFRRVARPTTVYDQGKTYELKEGDTIMINLKAVSRDPAAFPNPDVVNLTRPLESYIHMGHGAHQCLGLPMVRVALTTMLKTIFRSCPNLRPAKVSVGRESVESRVKKVVKEIVPGDAQRQPSGWLYHAYLMPDWDLYFPLPTSLKVNWDDVKIENGAA